MCHVVAKVTNTHNKCRDDSCHRGSNESLPCFLWRQLYQGCSSEEETENVSEDVIDYNQRCWKKKPALETKSRQLHYSEVKVKQIRANIYKMLGTFVKHSLLANLIYE